ncbi:hypothetical protein FDB15_04015 [Clostridium botulinum]|uniref:hypothetical protein n=1 Tax=unclassified Clostridium TaxID=2614128 RepID=UPI0013CB7698|nr:MULTISPECIES: hypothetical protein [unclassified Clostridium]NFH99486.1 hypothetical protein [Clostridium botulinum]NFI62179.1 hypothetical protein [Clostridium botulinum]NFJ42615.1 hypothetical protein [Clostridium botulinum]NFJ46514.1 hypothetical protein [Clostridium botulinum]NFK26444.1 hypothetical protein [Clostridium botulinum]
MNKQGVKIKSINGAEVLKLKEGKQAEFGKAVFSNSLLLDKLKELGLNINNQNSTKDIISVKFDYGYSSQEAKEMVEEHKKLKKDNRNSKSNVKKLDKEINSKTNQLKKAKTQLIELNDKLENETDLKIIKSLQSKINTRINKIDKLEKQLNELIFEYAINDEVKNIETELITNVENNINDNTYKKDALRDLLYNEGFSINIYKTVKKEKVFDKTITYKYWFRSGGKAKNGEDYFINSELYDSINAWQSMGIKLPATNAKLVEFEIYKSLVASAIEEDYIIIKPSEILVVNDLDCYSELQDVIKVVRNKETGLSEAIHTQAQCKNTIWDGMCLIQGGEGFRGLRHHFYKTGAFCCDFQQYFKDEYKDKYEDAEVIDRYGRKVKISEVKMITTENAMKWEKFLGASKESFEEWSKWVEENGCKFGICKRDHKSKYEKYQRMSYQMLNTLPNIDIEELFKDSKEYIYKLKNNDKFFIEHLKRTASEVNNNLLLADIATTYPTFVNSYYFKDNRKAEINKYKEQLQKGKLLIEGDNETILANPFLLLEYVAGKLENYIKDGVISEYIDETLPNKNSCYCNRFGECEIGAFRSPHNSPNNILYFENHIDEKMDKYFSSFGENVIAVNMLCNDVQDRGNGLDEDTDFLLCTTNKHVVDSCKKAQDYPTIVNDFVPSPKTYNNTMSDLSEVDDTLQNSQKAIGTSSNVAMLYLSQYWDRVNKINEIQVNDDTDMEYIEYLNNNNKKLLDNASILSVLAQVSVDCSKRAFEVGGYLRDKKTKEYILDKEGNKIIDKNGLNNEIDRLRKELPNALKPTFWQYTSSSFKNDEIEKKLKNKDKKAWKDLSKKEKKEAIKLEKKRMIEELYDYNCPFNLVLKEIDKIERADSNNRVSDENYLILWGNKKTQDRKQAKKIEENIKNFDSITKFINTNDDLEDDDNIHYYNVLYKEYLDKVLSLTIKLDTMSLMIIRALDKDNKYLKSNKEIRTKLLNILYKYSCKRVKDKKEKENIFLKCFTDYEK